jgi:hypothetical protein
MPQVYADKNGLIYGQKPDLIVRIKVEVGKKSLVHMRIKIVRPGSNQDLITYQLEDANAKPPKPLQLLQCTVV